MSATLPWWEVRTYLQLNACRRGLEFRVDPHLDQVSRAEVGTDLRLGVSSLSGRIKWFRTIIAPAADRSILPLLAREVKDLVQAWRNPDDPGLDDQPAEAGEGVSSNG